MKLYTATVQINAEPDNQVVKHKLTAAEMKVLEFVHAGKKPVLIDIQETGKVNRKDRAERARLAQNYSRGELAGDALVQKLFGVDGVPLPQEYEAPIIQAIEEINLDEPDDEEYEMIDPSTTKPVRALTAADIVG